MRVFLSYKREDQDFVEELRTNLIDWGYATWMDIHDIPEGAYWPDEIDKGLRESSVVIGVMSPRAIESRNVKNEWDWAIVNGTQLILLMLENCYIPMNYVSINYIDFTRDKSRAYEQLKAGLTKPQASMPPDPHREYLQQLYDRINTFLAQKIIARRPDEDATPEPLRLRSEATLGAVDALFEKREEIDPLYAIGGIEQGQPQQVFHDFERAFRYYEERVLLLGAPGAGKTITLLHFARDAVVRRMQNTSLPLPILGIVPTWDAHQQVAISKWLAISYGAPRDTTRMIHEGKALLLLDGLDELGSERPVDPQKPDGKRFDPRLSFMKQIAVLIAESPETQILVTCRPKDYEEIGEKIALRGAVTLKPLDSKQMQAYLLQQPALWEAVQADEGLRTMLQTPLLLSFFAFAYRDIDQEEQQQLRHLSHSPSDLRDKIFEAYVQGRYEHETRKLTVRGENMPFTLQRIYEVLTLEAKEDLVTSSRNSKNTLKSSDLVKRWGAQAETLMEWFVRLHMVVRVEEDSFRFIHLLLRDYFASAYWDKLVESGAKALPDLFEMLVTQGFGDYIRKNVVNSLVRIGNPAAAYLVERLNKNEQESLWFKDYMLSALARIGTPEAGTAVANWWNDRRKRSNSDGNDGGVLRTWLLVEDEPDISELMLMMIREIWGIECVFLFDGNDLSDWIEGVDSGLMHVEIPELAILDIRSLSKSEAGVGLGQRIRQSPLLGNTSIVLTTAYALANDTENELISASGADLMIGFPLPRVNELKGILESVIAKRKQTPL